MIKYDHPSSDEARLALLRRAAETATSDAAQGRYYLSTSKQEALQGALASFADAQLSMTDATGRYRTSVRHANKTVSYLRKQLQNSWDTVRWQVQWEALDTAVLSYYHLSLEGKAPAPKMRADWVELAGSVLNGDTSAMGAGHPGLPGRHVLETAYHQAHAALNTLGEAQSDQKAARRTLQATRKEANHICRSIVSDLRNNLRQLSPQARREIMRGYGVHFQGDEQEQSPPSNDTSIAPNGGEASSRAELLNGTEGPHGEEGVTDATPSASPSNGTVVS